MSKFTIQTTVTCQLYHTVEVDADTPEEAKEQYLSEHPRIEMTEAINSYSDDGYFEIVASVDFDRPSTEFNDYEISVEDCQ